VEVAPEASDLTHDGFHPGKSSHYYDTKYDERQPTQEHHPLDAIDLSDDRVIPVPREDEDTEETQTERYPTAPKHDSQQRADFVHLFDFTLRSAS
jgi:hypothetical protein